MKRLKSKLTVIPVIAIIVLAACQKHTHTTIDPGPLHSGNVTIRGVSGYTQSIPFYFTVPPAYESGKSWP